MSNYISDECHAYYLDLGKNGAGDLYEVNGEERYAFELGEEDFSKYPELKDAADGATYLLVGDGFWQFADSYEDEEDDEDEEEEEELDPRASAVVTLKMTRQGILTDDLFNLLLNQINDQLHENHGVTEPITKEEIDNG